jgi:hypothetical protein
MIEAMACGTPVLALRRGSVEEVVAMGIRRDERGWEAGRWPKAPSYRAHPRNLRHRLLYFGAVRQWRVCRKSRIMRGLVRIEMTAATSQGSATIGMM